MDVGARGQGRLGLGEGPPVPAGVTPRDQGTPRALALPVDMVGLSGQTSKPERCPFFLGLVEGRGGQKQDAGWVLPAAEAAVSASGSIPLAAPGLQPGDVGVELILPIASM